MAGEDAKQVVRRSLLGRGLRCDDIGNLNRDLRLGQGPNGLRDLDFVEGIDNLSQALSIALTTPLGGDVFNVDFGFDGLNALADEEATVLQRERIRASIVNLLRKDPRVSRIVDVRLIDQRLEAGQTGGSRELEVRVAFETVSSDRLALVAGASGARFADG